MPDNKPDVRVEIDASNKKLKETVKDTLNTMRGFDSEVKSTGGGPDFDPLTESIKRTQEQLNLAKNQFKQMTGTATSAIPEVKASTEQLGFSLSRLTPEMERFKSSVDSFTLRKLQSEFVETEYSFNKLTAQAEDLRQKMASSSDPEWIRAVNQELQLVIPQLDETGWKLQTIGARMEEINRTKLDKVKEEFRGMEKTADKSLKGIDKGLKRQFRLLKRFAVVLIGIRTFWSLITRSINSYIERNARLKAQIDGLMQGLGQVLAPLAELSVQALMKLVRWLAIVIAYVFTFINAIFGTNLAITTSAKSMKRLTDQTKKAVQASNKLLAPFDELNILTEDTGIDPNIGGAPEVMPDFSAFDLSNHLESLEKFRNFLIENKEMIKLLTIGALGFLSALLLIKVAMAILTLISSPWLLLATAIALVIGLLVYIIYHWDDLVEAFKQGLANLGQWFSEAWENIKLAVGAVWDWIKEKAQGVVNFIGTLWQGFVGLLAILWDWIKTAWTTTMDFISNLIGTVVQWFIDRWEAVKTFFSGLGTSLQTIWQTFTTWIQGRISSIGTFFSNIWAGIGNVAGNIWNGIRNSFSTVINFMSNAMNTIRTSFSNIFTSIGNAFKNAWEGVKNTFSNVWNWILGKFNAGGNIFTGIKDGILGAFKSIVNSLIRGINTVIGIPFRAINGLLNKIRDFSILGGKPFKNFWGYNPLSVPKIPQLATGAVVNKATLAMVGEGRYEEAVIPLGQSPQFTSMKRDIAEAVAELMTGQDSGDMEVNLIVDGERFGKVAIKNINKLQRKSGTTLLKV